MLSIEEFAGRLPENVGDAVRQLNRAFPFDDLPQAAAPVSGMDKERLLGLPSDQTVAMAGRIVGHNTFTAYEGHRLVFSPGVSAEDQAFADLIPGSGGEPSEDLNVRAQKLWGLAGLQIEAIVSLHEVGYEPLLRGLTRSGKLLGVTAVSRPLQLGDKAGTAIGEVVRATRRRESDLWPDGVLLDVSQGELLRVTWADHDTTRRSLTLPGDIVTLGVRLREDLLDTYEYSVTASLSRLRHLRRADPIAD